MAATKRRQITRIRKIRRKEERWRFGARCWPCRWRSNRCSDGGSCWTRPWLMHTPTRWLLLDSAMVNAHTNAVAHAIDLTKGFYVHFSNGFDPVNHPAQSRQAETFLRGIMRKDVICTEFQGVDLFLNQYKICTEGHASMRVFVHDIIVNTEGSSSQDGAIQILAKATARFRVSRATLEKFFPRIIDDEELTQQLIGKEYAIQYDKVFHFKHGRVFQHESQIDMCNSMLEMTQNIFVAMKLLEASLMTKHGHLKLDSNIVEDMNQLENTVL